MTVTKFHIILILQVRFNFNAFVEPVLLERLLRHQTGRFHNAASSVRSLCDSVSLPISSYCHNDKASVEYTIRSILYCYSTAQQTHKFTGLVSRLDRKIHAEEG